MKQVNTVNGSLPLREELPLRHIRVGVVRASHTIGTHYNRPGNPGNTLCGGEFTAYDWDMKDAKRASTAELFEFNVCRDCVSHIDSVR